MILNGTPFLLRSDGKNVLHFDFSLGLKIYLHVFGKLQSIAINWLETGTALGLLPFSGELILKRFCSTSKSLHKAFHNSPGLAPASLIVKRNAESLFPRAEISASMSDS